VGSGSFLDVQTLANGATQLAYGLLKALALGGGARF
jgi:hypothetical protein